MKTAFIIVAFILLITILPAVVKTYAEAENVTISAEDDRIVYMGRWYPDSRGVMHGGFECGLALRFTGTGISLSGRASGTVLIAIVGGTPVQKALTSNMAIARGLEAGEHLLEIYAAYQAAMPVISGFSIDPGAEFLPSEKGKLIEFVGDSIMEGYVDPNNARDGVFNSYALSYAFLTGRALFREYGMSFNTIAFGGIRVVAPGDNAAASGNDPLGMPERYFLRREYRSERNSERAVSSAGEWDTGRYAPDYIVLNLGTNDVSGGNVFTDAYAAFLKKLRETYPEATLFVMTPFNGNMGGSVGSVVESADDPKVILIDTSSWGIRGGADGLHPDPQAHERASELLLETLKPYLAPADACTAAPEETAAPTYSVVTPSCTEVGPKKAGSAVLPLAIAGGAVIAAALAGIMIFAIRKKK